MRRLAGGHTAAGAHELRDTAGARAVLKVYPWDVRSAPLRDTARLIDQAIAAGWRTPGWLASGELPEGGAYVVRSFVEGRPAADLGERELVQVHPPDARIIERLRDECLGLVGARGLLLCASTRIVGLAAWGFDHWPADLPAFARRCDGLLDSLVAP